MEHAEEQTPARSVSGVSLMVAILTFLAVWGGVTLLLTDPTGLHFPPSPSTPRGFVTSLLLFWLPALTGSLACLAGMIGLSANRGRQADVQYRAALGLILGLIPFCLAAAWLGWVLLSSTR